MLQAVGFAVYRLVCKNICSAEEGVKRFELSAGNNMLHRHVRSHEKSHHGGEKAISISEDGKNIIIHVAANAAAIDTLPLKVFQKETIKKGLAQSLVEFGQINYLGCSIDIASTIKEKFKERIPDFFNYSGGISCDGVKLEKTGKK